MAEFTEKQPTQEEAQEVNNVLQAEFEKMAENDIIKEYLEGEIGYKELAKKYSIPNKCAIQTWVSIYKTQGYDGIKVSRRNNKYSLEFKLNVVNLYLTGEMSYQSLANELKINNPSILSLIHI